MVHILPMEWVEWVVRRRGSRKARLRAWRARGGSPSWAQPAKPRPGASPDAPADPPALRTDRVRCRRRHKAGVRRAAWAATRTAAHRRTRAGHKAVVTIVAWAFS